MLPGVSLDAGHEHAESCPNLEVTGYSWQGSSGHFRKPEQNGHCCPRRILSPLPLAFLRFLQSYLEHKEEKAEKMPDEPKGNSKSMSMGRGQHTRSHFARVL